MTKKLHKDYVAGNTLCTAGRLTAILDFEMALPDARAMDVASGLMFSMRPWENPQPLVMLAAFLRGYGRWVQLSADETAALPWLMRLRNAVSAIWRLGRGLAAGKVTEQRPRVVALRKFGDWLTHNQAELVICPFNF